MVYLTYGQELFMIIFIYGSQLNVNIIEELIALIKFHSILIFLTMISDRYNINWMVPVHTINWKVQSESSIIRFRTSKPLDLL